MNHEIERNEINAKTEMLIGFCHGASRASLDEKASDAFYYIRNEIVEIYHLINKIEDTESEKFLNKSIKELGFTGRTQTCLLSDNIKTIGQLILLRENDLLKAPNLGKKSLAEIKEVLANYNLTLGMSK